MVTSDENVNSIRTQASLGNEYKRRYKEGENINTISLGKVIAYHPRYNTVDVVTYPRNDVSTDSYFTGGKFSAKLPVGFSGTDKSGNAYGQITPVEAGSLVVIGYVEGHKTTPIVLGIYGNDNESFDLSRSPVDSVDKNDPNQDKYVDDSFTVYPSLTYSSSDGQGNKAISFPGKSFLVLDSEANEYTESVSDDGLGTDYQDLDSSYYHSGKIITPKEGKAPTMLFRHQGDKLTDDGVEPDSHALMFFVDQDGTMRTSMVNKDEDWRSGIELRNDGRVSLKYQKDTTSLTNSQDYHELFIDDKGIGVVVDGKLTRVSDAGFGGINQGMFENVYNEITGELEEKISTFEQTYVGENGEFTRKTSELSQTVEEIGAKVNEITVYTEDDISSIAQEVLDQSNIYQEVIDKIVEDNIVTGAEKVQLATMYDMVKAEYPAYLKQAQDLDMDTTAYTAAYERLSDYIEPILENLDEVTSINGEEFREHFYDYYNAKNALVYAVFNDVNLRLIEAIEIATEAGKDAGEAMSQAGASQALAENALENLEDIANDSKITPQEKGYLSNLLLSIDLELEPNKERASEYGVDSSTYELAYDNLHNLIYDTYKVFDDTGSTTEVNPDTILSAFEDYYSARESLNSSILAETKRILTEVQGDFESYDSELTIAKDRIAANSGYIRALGEEVNLAYAYINLTPGRVSSGTTYAYFKRELSEPIGYNTVGENLFINSTVSEGALNPTTGKVDDAVDGDKTSNYIQVRPNFDYTATLFENKGNNRLVVTYYDDTFNYLTGSSVSSDEETFSLTSKSPSDAKYARVSSRNTDNVRVQFETGDGSSYFKANIADIGNDIVLATEEKDRRVEALAYFEKMLADATTHDSDFYDSVVNMTEDLQIDSEDKGIISNEYDKIKSDYTEILEEGNDQGINVSLMENRFLTLSGVLDDLLSDPIDTETLTNSESLPKLFKDFYNTKEEVLKIIVSNTEQSKEAAIELLDLITENAVKAEQIAERTRVAAEEILNSISLIQDMIVTTNEQEQVDYQIIKDISEDNDIIPTEIVDLVSIIDNLHLLNDILFEQARVFGLDTANYDKAYEELSVTLDPLTTPEGMLKQHNITNINFVGLWDAYYDERRSLINDILLSAEAEYAVVDERAIASREEALRRQEDFQDYQNAIKDSGEAIKRNTDKIEALTNSVPYIVEITSTNGTSFKNRVIQTQLSVRVFEGDTNITDSIPKEDLVWTKVNADGIVDTEWTERHEGIGNLIDISHTDFVNKATFFIDYTVEEEQ